MVLRFELFKKRRIAIAPRKSLALYKPKRPHQDKKSQKRERKYKGEILPLAPTSVRILSYALVGVRHGGRVGVLVRRKQLVDGECAHCHSRNFADCLPASYVRVSVYENERTETVVRLGGRDTRQAESQEAQHTNDKHKKKKKKKKKNEFY